MGPARSGTPALVGAAVGEVRLFPSLADESVGRASYDHLPSALGTVHQKKHVMRQDSLHSKQWLDQRMARRGWHAVRNHTLA